MIAWQRCSLILSLIATIALSADAFAADWLRFRGPNGNGIAPLHDQLPLFQSENDNVLQWKVKLPGPGSSCPIVVGDKVFVTCWSGYGVDRENPGEQSQLKRHLVCVNRKTGEILWDKTVDPYLPEDEYRGMFAEHGYASHTPVSDGQHVFVFFGKTGVLAFDMDGNQLWQTSVGTESGLSDWGTASSPLLYKNLVIVPATAESQALVGLDKATGQEVWRQEASGFGSVWGSPILVEVDGERTDLVIAVPNEIWGFNPENGKLRWYCEAMQNRSFCSSVVADQGIVYAIESGPGGGGGIAVRAGGKGDVTSTHVIWSGRQRNRIATPIVHEGLIYTFGEGIATCIDAANGEQVYRKRLRSSAGRGRGQDYASPVLAGNLIYFPSRSGELFVINAGREFVQLAATRLSGTGNEDFSATPAIVDGQLIIRSSESLYCMANDGDQTLDLTKAVEAAKAAAGDEDQQDAAEEQEEGRGRGRGFGRGPGGGFDPAAIFRQRDANGDGKLVGEEMDQRLRDRLEQIDTDKDGAVSEQEFLAGIRQMFGGPGRGEGRGPGGGRGRGFGGRGGGGGDYEGEQRPERPTRPELE